MSGKGGPDDPTKPPATERRTLEERGSSEAAEDLAAGIKNIGGKVKLALAKNDPTTFRRNRLDRATTVELLENFEYAHPEHADRMPSFEGLNKLINSIIKTWEYLIEIDKKTLNRRYSAKEWEIFIAMSRELGNIDHVQHIYEILHEIYNKILGLAALFQYRDLEGFINQSDFSANEKAVTQIEELLEHISEVVSLLREQCTQHSRAFAKEAEIGDEYDDAVDMGRTNPHHMANMYMDLIMETQMKGLYKDMRTNYTKSAVSRCITTLEVGLYNMTKNVADPLLEFFSKLPNGQRTYEKLFPFKANFLIYNVATLLQLLPPLRVHIDMLGRMIVYRDRITKQ